MTQRWFRCVWELEAALGYCDGSDGAEYRRVYSEWIAAGKPMPCGPFIRRRANVDAEGNEPTLPEE